VRISELKAIAVHGRDGNGTREKSVTPSTPKKIWSTSEVRPEYLWSRSGV